MPPVDSPHRLSHTQSPTQTRITIENYHPSNKTTWVCVSVCVRDSNTCVNTPGLTERRRCAQVKVDLVKEVAYTRRKQHQASMQYYCALNALQYRKRVAMLEPMLGYTQAQVGPPPAHHTVSWASY